VSSTPSEVTVAFQPANRVRADRAAQGKPVLQPARIARQLALAHVLQWRIDCGEFRNQAALARALGFSRERISKILDLLLLAPDLQEELLFLECFPGRQEFCEASLHNQVLNASYWEDQRRCWATVQVSCGAW
jgi:hypothetical protein